MRMLFLLLAVVVCTVSSAQGHPGPDLRRNYGKADSTLKNLELDSVVVLHDESEVYMRQSDTTRIGSIIETDSSLTVELYGLKSSCGSDAFYYEYSVDRSGVLRITAFDGPVCQGGYSTDVILYFSRFPEKAGPQITAVALENYSLIPLPLRKQ